MSYSQQMQIQHAGLLSMKPDYKMEIDFLASESVEATSILSSSDRWLSALAVLMGVSAEKEFKKVLKGALDDGFSPVKIRESVYQATDYLGLGRMYPFLKMISRQFARRGIELESQSITTPENRLKIGND